MSNPHQSAEKLYNIRSIGTATFIHYPDGREIPTLLTPAGADVPNSFLGRTEEKAKIRALLTTRQRPLALVNAEGGMGKTTLAAYYWREYAGEYQHMAWVFCERGILNALLSQLPQPLGLSEQMTAALQQVIGTNTPKEPSNCAIMLHTGSMNTGLLTRAAKP